MTGSDRNLERSLREGPPDETHYRPESIVVRDRIVLGPSAGPVGTERIRGIHTGRRPRLALPASYLAAVIVVAVAAGGLALLDGVGRPGPSGLVGSPIPIPVLSETFVSPRNGFSVRYPAGWTVTAASAAWPPDVFLPLGNPALDDLQHLGEARLVAASQPLAAGQTEAEWLGAFTHPFSGPVACATDPEKAPRLPVGGQSGYLDTPGCPMPADTKFSNPDLEFSAIVFAGRRVYRFSLDGNVDLAYFKAILATIVLDPAGAVDTGG